MIFMRSAISRGAMSVLGDFIHKTQNLCVHQDPLIPLPGFIVIVPRRHIQSLAAIMKSEIEDFSKCIFLRSFIRVMFSQTRVLRSIVRGIFSQP